MMTEKSKTEKSGSKSNPGSSNLEPKKKGIIIFDDSDGAFNMRQKFYKESIRKARTKKTTLGVWF
jgi:hypothetical protein